MTRTDITWVSLSQNARPNGRNGRRWRGAGAQIMGHYCNVIEAPWLVNGRHGASLRHHKRTAGGALREAGAQLGQRHQPLRLATLRGHADPPVRGGEVGVERQHLICAQNNWSLRRRAGYMASTPHHSGGRLAHRRAVVLRLGLAAGRRRPGLELLAARRACADATSNFPHQNWLWHR
eukprot:COSAG01_NODE_13938_length_1507_cov_1.336627_2_plen_178_part_00